MKLITHDSNHDLSFYCTYNQLCWLQYKVNVLSTWDIKVCIVLEGGHNRKCHKLYSWLILGPKNSWTVFNNSFPALHCLHAAASLEKKNRAYLVDKLDNMYTVLHMFRQLLFWTGNQGNHQNPFLLPKKFRLIFMGMICFWKNNPKWQTQKN